MIHRLPLLLLPFLLAGNPRAVADPPAKRDLPMLPTEEVTKAWTDAGATLGWLRDDGSGRFNFIPEKKDELSGAFIFRTDPERQQEDVPAFGFLRTNAPEGLIAKLPDPKAPFGLVLGRGATDAVMQDVAGQSSLQVLYVQFGDKLTDDGLKPLAALQKLEKLELQYTVLKGTGVEHLTKLKQFRSLALLGQDVSDEGLAAVAKLTHLHVLNLNECLNVTDTGVQKLAGLKNLRVLDLRWTKLTDLGVKKLSGLIELQQLSLSKTGVSDAGVTALAGMKGMQLLNLEQTRVTDAGLEQLAAMAQLRTLVLNKTRVSGSGLAYLAKAKELRALDLGDTPTTAKGVTALIGLKGLRELDLSGSGITDELVKPLARMSDLEVLLLRRTPVTDAGLEHLGEMKSLRLIALGQTKITEAGVDKLQKALPKCRLAG